jgi:hypothetical protein
MSRRIHSTPARDVSPDFLRFAARESSLIVEPFVNPILLASGIVQISPLAIDAANLKEWARPDASLVTLSSGKVAALTVRGGGGDANKNLAQATGGSQPTYNATDAAYNNRPTMSFNSSQLHSVGNWAASLAQPFTIYLVGQSASGHAQQAFFDDSAGTTVIYATDTSNDLAIYAGVSLSSSTVTTNPSVMCLVFNGASSAIYVNDATTAKATGNASGAALVSAVLGDNASASTPLVGKIADHIVYAGAHNHANRSAVMSAYAAAWFGITVTP